VSTTLTAAPTVAPVVPIALDEFGPMLTALRADCVREREAALAESATSLPDAVAVSRAGRLMQTIGEIDAALLRVADGSYGRCLHCGARIPAERLEVRPFAAGCVGCDGRAR